MSAEFQRTKPRRLAFLAVCFAVMAIVLLTRLFYWQVLRRQDVLLSSPGNGPEVGGIAWRGSIYDSHGHFLAVPSLVYDVGATPRSLTDSARVAELLAPLLGVPQSELSAKLSQKDRMWVPLALNLPAPKGRAVKDLKLLGIKLDVRPGRYYPEQRLAASVLGFVNSEQRGYYGVEEYYDSRLRGSPGGGTGGLRVLLDLPFGQPPKNGADLVLTIDRVVQRAAEQRLEAALRDYQAQSGSIIVMDPRTGAILAMAVAPSYDPNAYTSVRSSDAYVNKAISEPYEPGSVFKIVTMAAALDAGVIHRDDTYEDRGQIEVGGRLFRNWDRQAHGHTTMTQILAYSLNVGAIEVAMRLGPDRFYEAVRRFGFGEVTGIDLAGEVAGTIRVPGTPYWSMSDLAANSFGQGLAVTPIQLVAAVAAVANQGVLMRPYVVDKIIMDGQVVWQATPQAVRRVIAPNVADELCDMLAHAMPEETSLAIVPGYTCAGKTGTAQIAVNGQYDEKAVIASFAGFLPAKDPRFVILVKLDRPQREAWGSRSAAPVWRSLASQLCAYMGIPPDQP